MKYPNLRKTLECQARVSISSPTPPLWSTPAKMFDNLVKNKEFRSGKKERLSNNVDAVKNKIFKAH